MANGRNLAGLCSLSYKHEILLRCSILYYQNVMQCQAEFLEKMTCGVFKSVMHASLHIFPRKGKMTKNFTSDKRK